MRVSVIAVGKDYGSAIEPDKPTPDGPVYTTAWTKVEVRDAGNDHRYLYIDSVPIGEIVAIVIDHEDEKAPPTP